MAHTGPKPSAQDQLGIAQASMRNEEVRREVLRLSADGCSSADIALALDLSRNKVDRWTHQAQKPPAA